MVYGFRLQVCCDCIYARNKTEVVYAPSEEESDESKDSFYEELDQVFDHFPKYHMKMLLGDF